MIRLQFMASNSFHNFRARHTQNPALRSLTSTHTRELASARNHHQYKVYPQFPRVNSTGFLFQCFFPQNPTRAHQKVKPGAGFETALCFFIRSIRPAQNLYGGLCCSVQSTVAWRAWRQNLRYAPVGLEPVRSLHESIYKI